MDQIRDLFSATGPEAALCEHSAALSYDDGAGPFDEELEWLLRVSGGAEPVEMLSVATGCCPTDRHNRVHWHNPPVQAFVGVEQVLEILISPN